MNRKISILTTCFLLVPVLAVLSTSCQSKKSTPDERGKLNVVTTLFPLYDFSKSIGGDRVNVSLLLPPGVEAHSFEPGPSDISRIQNADIFIFMGPLMEPWVEQLLHGVDTSKVIIVDASTGIHTMDGHHDEEEKEGHGHGAHVADPHIWLDFSNAIKMVNTITSYFIKRDPENREIYLRNGEAYGKDIEALDEKYRKKLSGCKSRTIIYAGHFAFGYLAKRYDMKYISANKGFMPDAEPTPKRIAEIITIIKKYGMKSIYCEELISPKVADTIARETGCNVLMLHGAHNISKEDLTLGTSFISLMEKNLENLRIGLQCP
jgi:zinc transport system substrate-binding protein